MCVGLSPLLSWLFITDPRSPQVSAQTSYAKDVAEDMSGGGYTSIASRKLLSTQLLLVT